jgi:membrane protein implicated in regulation of membrane protease activity
MTMTAWSIWFVLAGIALALEITSGTFYLLMIAAGLAAGGIAALTGVMLEWQLLVASIVGLVGTVGLRRSSFGKLRRKKASRDQNVLLDIGQTVQVSDWTLEGDTYVAQVRYRGASWRAELLPGGVPQAGTFVIEEIRGSNLLVAHVVSH